MDIVILGKESFAHSAKPHVIYCGQSRDEGLKAVKALNGKFPNVYYVDAAIPGPRIAVYPPAPEAPVQPPVSADPQTKQKKSK